MVSHSQKALYQSKAVGRLTAQAIERLNALFAQDTAMTELPAQGLVVAFGWSQLVMMNLNIESVKW